MRSSTKAGGKDVVCSSVVGCEFVDSLAVAIGLSAGSRVVFGIVGGLEGGFIIFGLTRGSGVEFINRLVRTKEDQWVEVNIPSGESSTASSSISFSCTKGTSKGPVTGGENCGE